MAIIPDTPRRRGFVWDMGNSRLSVEVDGTEVARFNDGTADLTLLTNGLTITAGGATVTAGNLVVTAGDDRVTAGNLRLGAISTFGTTEPTSAAVFKTGTAPAGAITTSGGVFSSTTVMRKIIAAGTVSNIET